MIKQITDFLLMLLFILMLPFTLLIVIVATKTSFDRFNDKIEPMPFDSRLCTNTGKMHRYIVIGEKGVLIERYEPILDCTNLDKYNGV